MAHSSPDSPCTLCSRSGLLCAGRLCPACMGAGYVSASGALVAALTAAATYHGAPATLALAELHRRWHGPTPTTSALLLLLDRDLDARLRDVGLVCRLVDAHRSVTVEMLVVADAPE